MPYKTADDPTLPNHIKKLPIAKRSQFVQTFNRTYNDCKFRLKGTDCEGKAFRIANAAVAKERDEGKMRVSKLSDLIPLEISEGSLVDQDGRKELVVTLLREGPGNKFHNNYYTKSALKTAAKEIMSRPKQYINHAKDIDNPDRDLRDWASTIMETWVDDSEAKHQLKARVKVYDEWLWERAKRASSEMAVSIEGKGSGRPETIEGQTYNAIHEIKQVNGVNWVDYPGNAGFGVQVLEKDKNLPKEDSNMEFAEILESMKTLSEDQKKKLIEDNPDLKEFFLFPPQDDGKTDKAVAELREQIKAIKESAEAEKKAIAEKMEALAKEKAELANKVEAHELVEKERAREKQVEALIKASKLDEKHVTETFRKTLMDAKDEDSMKKLIEDREKICVVPVADPNLPGGGAGNELSEAEKANEFTKNIFGEDISEYLGIEKK